MGSITLRYISGEGDEVVTSLAEADAGHVAHGRPVRGFGSHAGMKHYPGWWWSSTTTSLIPYESLLERDRLLAADFDRDVVAIASQPFGLTGQVQGTKRRHVPDFLLVGSDGTPTVVDVKPARLAARPVVAETLEWTAHLLHERGWRYEVWTGLDSTVRENLRFLAAGRRPDLADPEALAVLRGTDVRGRLIGHAVQDIARSDGLDERLVRGAATTALWSQEWVVELREPVSDSTVIQQTRGESHAGSGS
ncbi:TnsA-like heteromeric transposase endonuclease subunit [Janibacter indicus]|uniref:TnsA-like heteromeric transposase endonuclease subunit n=1 Tax=Janibacter indicus TaxID=857417 RepID=UPI001F40478E|nr:TnsA-like heteromeric transposase endonuclease subunit [Janibacter indicus]